jgi:glycosyltransferase involved in cell wall biosynthesis
MIESASPSRAPLRVLHVIASMSPQHGGPTDAILNVLPHLADHGIDAMVVSTSDDRAGVLDVPLAMAFDYCGCQAIFFANTFHAPQMLRDFGCSMQMDRWLRENSGKFDVLHIHALFSFATARAMAIARSVGVPYICRPLGVLGRWPLSQGGWHKRWFLRLFDRRNLNRAAAIEYNSDAEMNEAAVLGLAAPARLLPLGFQPVPLVADARANYCMQLELDEQGLNVLFMSRLHPKKGLRLLIEACGQLFDERFQLLIAGTGEAGYVDEMKGLVSALGLSNRVRWLGFLEGEQKARALCAADVMVLPSLSESFGIVVAEALSAGCAVVTTAEVPMAEWVCKEDAGWLVQAEAGSIASALREAMAEPGELARRRLNAGRITGSSLTYKALAPALASLYQEVAGKGEPRDRVAG